MDRIVLLLPALFFTAACTTKDPRGTISGRDAGVGDGSAGGDGSVIVDPGDGGVLPPPDATVVDGVYDPCPDFEHADLEVPIRVNDQGNAVDRDPALTSFLIPFAREDGVFSLNSLVVEDETGARLPAQLEPISRWGGHPEACASPIRYAYAHVRAAPPAGAEATWFVRSLNDPAEEDSPLVLTESPLEWVVDTGPARFTVSRERFQGLTKVELRDTQGNLQIVSELSGEPGFVLERNGTKRTDAIAPWYLALERKGKQVVTIAARGYYGRDDMAYTIRLHFVAGSATVRVDHTYYYGEVAGWNADGAYNTTNVERAFMQIPLAEATSGVRVRGDTTVHSLGAGADVRIEQEKRLPGDDEVRFRISNGGAGVEAGTFARHPFLAVDTPSFSVMGTVANIAHRDPQGLSYDAASNALRLDFTSSPIQIGGARGIWSVGAIAFSNAPLDEVRADALLLHAERPLLGAPKPEYINGTATIGPYAADENGPEAALFPLLAEIHEKTKQYYEDLRITGIQIWPDLTSSSCYVDFDCDAQRTTYYEGGDNNYWNWSKPGIDEFFRTGNNDFIYAFSLGEARTYAETIAIRTYHDRLEDSSVTGLAPCYGSSRGFSGDFIEGLNNRRDNCPADYSYSKTLKAAYLATGDRRFVDYFEEAGIGAVNAFGEPPIEPAPYLELNLTRLSEQRLENLANGAEFAKDEETSTYLRQKLLDYVNFMLGRSLIDGHACDTASTGQNDARNIGYCASIPGWMAPVPVEWAVRTARFFSHPALADWVQRHGEQSMANMTVLDASGLPDYSQAWGDPGWRTGYECDTNQDGVIDSTCARYMTGENESYYYENGMQAFLNLFGLILSADPSDPHRICDWLPGAFESHLTSISDYEINERIWGKTSGQAFGMAAEAAGALSGCR